MPDQPVTLANSLSVPTASGATLPATSYGTLPLLLAVQTPNGVPTVTFNLPSAFNHATLKGQARADNSGNSSDMYIQFNGDTGFNYVAQQLFGNNNVATSSQAITSNNQ